MLKSFSVAVIASASADPPEDDDAEALLDEDAGSLLEVGALVELAAELEPESLPPQAVSPARPSTRTAAPKARRDGDKETGTRAGTGRSSGRVAFLHPNHGGASRS